MRNHADSEGIVRLYAYLLAPMIVEKLFVGRNLQSAE